MKFHCTIDRATDGRWLGHHDGQVGKVEVAADSRDAVLEKLEGELRYRLELCPCSGDSYQHIQIEIID